MNFIDQIVSNIIRPSRQQYRIGRLGPKIFNVKINQNLQTVQVQREDFSIINNKSNKIQLSYFGIQGYQCEKLPCVIYLHANNGSRNQGLRYLNVLLENGFAVVLFDCTGSGISEGQYITLGLQQSQDLDFIIEFLYKLKKINEICLWGRSMGAITALFYASRNKRSIKACIYDSPFSSLKKLIKQLASDKSGLPKFFFTPLIPFIQKQIKQKTSFSIYDLKMKKVLPTINCPGYFLTSKKDKLVNCRHSQRLYEFYPGQKYIEYIDNHHNQNRPNNIIKKCIEFLLKQIQKSNYQGINKQKTFLNLTINHSLLSSDKSTLRDKQYTTNQNSSVISNIPNLQIGNYNFERKQKVSVLDMRKNNFQIKYQNQSSNNIRKHTEIQKSTIHFLSTKNSMLPKNPYSNNNSNSMHMLNNYL